MVRLAVSGATGRMGGAVAAAASERDDVETVLALARSPGGTVAGVDIEDADAVEGLLVEREPDVLVDFTAPAATVGYAEACAEAGVGLVVGTTGFYERQLSTLRDASAAVPVLKAANFAPGIAVLESLLAEAAASLDDYDAELIETHHNGKRDAPSGTAKRLLSAIEGARDVDGESAPDGENRRVHGREGEAPRRENEVGVHAVRAGDVTGIHEVLLAGNHEELRLTHRIEDRGVFAAGAVDAAAWLAGREPGWYDFEDALAGDAGDGVNDAGDGTAAGNDGGDAA